MRKHISLLLVLTILLAMAVPAFAATADTAQPWYVNTSQARITLSISDTGLATITLVCTGLSSVSHIDAEVYLERQVGSTWVRVDNGMTDDTWTFTSANRFMVQSFTHQLTVKSKYRATVTYTVHGSSQDEVLTFDATRDYV